MLADGGDQGLDDVHLSTAHAGSKLDVEVVVAESRDVGRFQGDFQDIGYFLRQVMMRTSTEESNVVRIDFGFHKLQMIVMGYVEHEQGDMVTAWLWGLSAIFFHDLYGIIHLV